MEQLINTVIGGLAVLVIAKVFGLGGSTVRVVTTGNTSSKKWKWVIFVSWLMLIGGSYLFSINDGQFDNFIANNVYAMFGADIMGLSVPVWIVGQIGAWFNRN